MGKKILMSDSLCHKLLSLAEETQFVPDGIASLIVLAMSDE